MTLEIYTGSNPGTRGRMELTIAVDGCIHVKGGLARQIPVACEYFQVGWDRSAKLLVIMPSTAPQPGASHARCLRASGRRQYIRLSFHHALKNWGLIPPESYAVAAVWSDERRRIEAVLPTERLTCPEKTAGATAKPESAGAPAAAGPIGVPINKVPERAENQAPLSLYVTRLDIQRERKLSTAQVFQYMRDPRWPQSAGRLPGRGRPCFWWRADVDAFFRAETAEPQAKREPAEAILPLRRGPGGRLVVSEPANHCCGNCGTNRRLADNSYLCTNDDSPHKGQAMPYRGSCDEYSNWRRRAVRTEEPESGDD